MQNKRKTILINIVSAIATLLCVFLFLFSICFLTFNLSYVKTRVRGYSMLPTINQNVKSPNVDGDVVYINTREQLKQNTIVVADVDWWKAGSIIKRLVALPGDCVQIEDTGNTYDLKVNGKLVYSKQKYDDANNLNLSVRNYYQRKYLAFINNTTTFDGNNIDHSTNIGEFDGKPCVVLNDDEYFLVGDNWSDAMVDCMTFGPVKKADIVGTVDWIIDAKSNKVFEVCKIIVQILFKV